MARKLNTKLDGLQLRDNLLTNVPVVTEATASAVTYTAANFTSGLILRDPNGGARTDITPTAAQLYDELGNPEANSAFEVTIRNTADAAETITMSGGTGVTISGTATIAQSNSKTFLVVFTSPTVATMYSLGTVVH